MFNCGQLDCNWKLSKNDKTLHQGLKTPHYLTTYGFTVGTLAGDYTMKKDKFEVKDQVVIITGASQGIGREYAQFCPKQMLVCIMLRDFG